MPNTEGQRGNLRNGKENSVLLRGVTQGFDPHAGRRATARSRLAATAEFPDPHESILLPPTNPELTRC
jgi:hypothetical protein